MALYDGIEIKISVDYGDNKGFEKVGSVKINALVDSEKLDKLIDHIHDLWSSSGVRSVQCELKTKADLI
jgi:hypothetical protein